VLPVEEPPDPSRQLTSHSEVDWVTRYSPCPREQAAAYPAWTVWVQAWAPICTASQGLPSGGV
jgi:hypothetical protein